MFIAEGTIVTYAVYTMHRRKDLYGEDAEEFNPDSMLNCRISSLSSTANLAIGWATLRPGWEYLPFNGGPRICLGQQYALTEASYVTVRLLQEFKDIQSRDPGPWEENLTLTTCGKNGAKVGLTPA